MNAMVWRLSGAVIPALLIGSALAADMDMDKGMAKEMMAKHMDKDGMAGEGMMVMNPGQMKWMAAPPDLPKGGQLTVLQGDPGKAGQFVLRLKMPAGYKIAPHWHTQDENVTVISGTLYLGMGDTLDKAKAQPLRSGGYHSIPAKVHHYAFTKVPTVVQLHGEGPFDIHYLNPADNPNPAK